MASDNRFRAAALLDRDGTIIPEKEFLASPDEVELLPGAAEAIRILNQENIAAVITTNQSGIPRGYVTEENLKNIHQVLLDQLKEKGARIDAVYFAPSLPGSEDPRRKPQTGMYEDARRDLNLGGVPVYAIGDRTLDVEFGVNCGGKGIRVLTGLQLKEDLPNKLQKLIATRQKGLASTAEDLMEAVHSLLVDLAYLEIPEDRSVHAKFADMYATSRALDAERAHENRIVLANGCFDLIHGGHVNFLEAARDLGDKLVLALNSDASMKRIKGPERPILLEPERIQLLANLRCVDYLTIFHEDTADHLLEVIRPDIHAKGTDYKPGEVPEGETAKRLGFETKIAGDPKENSTRDIIDVVLERARAGLL